MSNKKGTGCLTQNYAMYVKHWTSVDGHFGKISFMLKAKSSQTNMLCIWPCTAKATMPPTFISILIYYHNTLVLHSKL